MVMIFGEISTGATVNYEQVIRDTIKEIGYDDPGKGLDYNNMNVIVAIEEQSPDIAQSVDSRCVSPWPWRVTHAVLLAGLLIHLTPSFSPSTARVR